MVIGLIEVGSLVYFCVSSFVFPRKKGSQSLAPVAHLNLFTSLWGLSTAPLIVR